MLEMIWGAIRWLARTLAIWAIALILLFEEWGWDYLAALLAWFGRLPGLRWLEARIRTLPPYAALALFAVPLLSLLPVKILALYWLSHGQKLLGLGVIVAAKVIGTAVTARLFMLTQASLMQLAWFAAWFVRWMRFKDAVLAQVRQSGVWRQWRKAQERVRQGLAGLRRWWRHH